jgi:hypothetical protein
MSCKHYRKSAGGSQSGSGSHSGKTDGQQRPICMGGAPTEQQEETIIYSKGTNDPLILPPRQLTLAASLSSGPPSAAMSCSSYTDIGNIGNPT